MGAFVNGPGRRHDEGTKSDAPQPPAPRSEPGAAGSGEGAVDGKANAAPARVARERSRHEDEGVAEAIEALLARTPERTRSKDILRELLTYVMQLPTDHLNRGELKILSSAFRDFRHAFNAFGPHRDRKKISIFGSARTPPDSPLYAHCRSFARAATERGYMIITGAGPGIMEAGHEGATRELSFGVSIDLPFEDRANPIIDGDPKHVHFKYFFTRKLSFVKESDAIVLFPGGFGTMDEMFESLTLLQTGKSDPKPLIMMDLPGGDYWPSWERYLRENLLGRGLISSADRNLYRFTSDVEAAINEIELFYRSYHSIRYVGDFTILRLKHRPPDGLMALLNERYRDLLADGDFELMETHHPAERNEPEPVRALPRIGFRFVKRGFGRLRRLIDEINLAEPPPTTTVATQDIPAGSGAMELPAPWDGDEGED